MIGRRNDMVFPEPVCDCMNTSRAFMSSEEGFVKIGRAARWIDVGLVIPILDCM